MLLADEYDAAQELDEVPGAHTGAKRGAPEGNAIGPASAADLGLSRKEIHEARQFRDAEEADPGITRRGPGVGPRPVRRGRLHGVRHGERAERALPA